MLTKEENELLCRVEGDAPAGQLMRRYWIPAFMLEEVAQPDGTPLRVKLLGEDLIAFRDSEGRLGVLGEYCPHRRASLAYGRNEEGGVRCLYHGWKMDVEGNVIDMPSEPAASRMCDQVKHTSYPVREAGGLGWVYMGPPDLMPEFEQPAFVKSEHTQVSIVKMRVGCNWAQILEGAIDSAHSSTLHSSDIRPARVDRAGVTSAFMTRPSTDVSPRIQVELTSFGMRYVAIRRPITGAETHQYLRITTFIAPFTVLIPPNSDYSLVQLSIPMDDYNTMFIFIAWSDGTRGIDQEAFRKFCGAQVGIDLDQNFNRVRTRANDYLQDRKAMKLGHFTGINGIPNQDIAMWETMGRIADRTGERLGASDIAIVQFRRLMVDAISAFRDGAQPIGTGETHTPHVHISSYEGVVPKSVDWRTLGVPAPKSTQTEEVAEEN
jgi:phthalate 4,5-dioxygenase oxygenase subunit